MSVVDRYGCLWEGSLKISVAFSLPPLSLLLELRMMEVVVITGAIKHAKRQQTVVTDKPAP